MPEIPIVATLERKKDHFWKWHELSIGYLVGYLGVDDLSKAYAYQVPTTYS